MPILDPWDINEGFEAPSNGKEYLFLDVEAPDFVETSTYLHTNTSAKFADMGISSGDLDNYHEGEHVFVVYFEMKAGSPDTPTRNVRTVTSAFKDTNGQLIHVLALADKRKKKYKRSGSRLVSDFN